MSVGDGEGVRDGGVCVVGWTDAFGDGDTNRELCVSATVGGEWKLGVGEGVRGLLGCQPHPLRLISLPPSILAARR